MAGKSFNLFSNNYRSSFLFKRFFYLLGNGNDNCNGSGRGNGNANGDFNNDGTVPKNAAGKVTALATDAVSNAIPGGSKVKDVTNNVGGEGDSGEPSNESNDNSASNEDSGDNSKPHKDDDGHFSKYPQYYSYNKGKNSQTVAVSAPTHEGLVSGLLGGLL